MCGIVGIAGELPSATIREALRRMNASIVHRGPDDEGMHVEDGFGFGMRRLSIIDLSTGGQPMWDERSGAGIVYNGEVYNYRELRRRYDNGQPFRTKSDTEVVLRVVATEGEEAISLLNGMFAFGIWHPREKALLLVRDRMGKKPLYYYNDNRMLVFASELKAILASGLIDLRWNEQAIWDYLTFRYVPGPETVWNGIYKLPPGTYLRWSADQPFSKIQRYWQSDVISPEGEADLEAATGEFEELFLDAVGKRLEASDVPVGVLLSGGLDSSCVASAAVELGHRNFHTFSVGYPEGDGESELPYAKLMAEHVGSIHHELTIDQDNFWKLLPEAVCAADEPLADLAAVPVLAVSRLAREHVKVVLSGEGSDEILAGYDFDRNVAAWQWIERLQQLPHPVLKALSLTIPGKIGKRVNKVASVQLKNWCAVHNAHMTYYFSEKEKLRLWPEVRCEPSARILQQLYKTTPSEKPLDQMLSVYQQSWLVEDLLMKADKMTMWASLELRVPFLDYRLVSWSNRQAQNVKVGRFGGSKLVTKNVLRRYAANRLPKAIIDRPKKGFPVPDGRWLDRPAFRRQFSELVAGSESKITDIFERNALRELIGTAWQGVPESRQKLWLLAVLELWLRNYGKSGRY